MEFTNTDYTDLSHEDFMKTQFTRSGAVALLLLAGAVAPAYSQDSQDSQDAKAGEVLAKTR